jgi:SPP1 gp7 family putative phage head morphogenesis protein
LADKAHLLTDKKLEQMEKRLSAIYSEAQKDIQKKADEYFDKFKKADAEKRKLVKAGKLTEDEYKAWRQGKIMYGKRFTAMKEDVAKQLLNVNQTATAYINGELPEVYALNYNALAETVDGVGGYSFTLTDADTVRHLATTDKSLLPFRELDPAKDIPWNMKKINSQVLQGVIQGESIPKIAKRIGNVQEMNKDAAIRSARTIVTGAENKGRMDSYQRAQDDGIILEKEWLAAIDKRTRDWHRDLNGVSIPIDKPFHNDFGDIMFPGDPSADGANVYNCRCSMASVVKGFKKAQVEKAMEEKTYKSFTKEEYENFQKPYELSPEENKKFDGYIGNKNSFTINKALRRGESLSPENQRLYDDMIDIIGKQKLTENIKVTRYADEAFLQAISGKDGKPVVGSIIQEKGFLSTSAQSDMNIFAKRRNVKMTMLADEGTNAFVTGNKRESEIIFAPNTKYEITSASSRIDNSDPYDEKEIWELVVKIIG